MRQWWYRRAGFVTRKLELMKLFFAVFVLSFLKLQIQLNVCDMQAYTKLLMKKRLHVNASLATLLLKGKDKSCMSGIAL